MNRYIALALAGLALALPAVACGSTDAGPWKRLPAAPVNTDFDARTSVWTGKELVVFGRDVQTALDARGNPYATGSINVAAAYDPQSNSWRRLSPPARTSAFMGLSSVWTGTEMLVWGQGTRLAYNPASDEWRQLPDSPLLKVHDGHGAVVWTGRELLGWGGGCCGDAFSDGVAYDVGSNVWHALPRAPLAGSQHPLGVWTGRQYVVLAGSRGAAYAPAHRTWRRIATPPFRSDDATAVWTGKAIIVVSGSRRAASYDPAHNRWAALPSVPPGRLGKVVAWDGARVLVWGGTRGGAALVPGARRWTAIPHGPLPTRLEPTAVWSGKSLFVWGGLRTKTWGSYDNAGAVYTPARP